MNLTPDKNLKALSEAALDNAIMLKGSRAQMQAATPTPSAISIPTPIAATTTIDATAKPASQSLNELAVFTHAKKLTEQLFSVTKNAPKASRWNIVDSMLKTSLAVIEMLYEANAILDPEERLALQRRIDARIKFLSFIIVLAYGNEIIKTSQRDFISTLMLETRKALWQWIHCNSAYQSKKKKSPETKKEPERERRSNNEV